MELDAAEQRVLGCLIEKAATTPQTYPLTSNAVRMACNQSTNRHPLVDYDDRAVDAALVSLRSSGLTRVVHSPSNRAAKHRHVLDEVLEVGPDEVAVIAILLLRGDQTVGEIKARTERLHRFGGLDEVEGALGRLARRSDPLVVQLVRRPGQKDARWSHLLGPSEPADRGDPEARDETTAEPTPDSTRNDSAREDRLAQLENTVDGLIDQVAALEGALDTIRREFGV